MLAQSGGSPANLTINGPSIPPMHVVKVFATGDIDQDGDVDGSDWLEWENLWNDWFGPRTRNHVLDYQGPNDM
jgi:hypothetical protein